MEVEMKSAQDVADELGELENKIVWSREAQARWKTLVWVLGIDREPPWSDSVHEVKRNCDVHKRRKI